MTEIDVYVGTTGPFTWTAVLNHDGHYFTMVEGYTRLGLVRRVNKLVAGLDGDHEVRWHD